MIGKTISHYRIIEELGRGGMGLVYKAEDTKLNRTVALKFLPPELTYNKESKARFIREARAASALEHDNICTIHEIDETNEGQLYIVMACYEGNTLRSILNNKQLSINESIAIAEQIAKGLQKAHEKGIVHRDIKPANIFITDDGSVKILDFGLAKLAGQTKLTINGSTVGTVDYMSPEQSQGQEVDHRTDIWSLGVILFELITGQLPFKADYDQAVIYSILNETPSLSESQRSDIPMDLERIVLKTLSKNPDDRFQNVTELLQELNSIKMNFEIRDKGHVKSLISKTKWLNRKVIYSIIFIIILVAIGLNILQHQEPDSKSNIDLQRIAVLPFNNLKSGMEADFLGFALADQIIGALYYIKNVLVRPSDAIRQYQNRRVDARTAGKELKVDYILTGHFLKEENNIRLNMELINIQTNEMIWRESIEMENANTFALQDIVAKKVIDGLRIQFSQDERERMQVDVPQNPLAYEYFLRCVSFPLSIDESNLSVNMVKKSIQLDSLYAPAWNELGFRLKLIGNYDLHQTELKKQAENAFLKALSLNKQSLSTMLNLVSLYTESARTDEAVKLAKRMLTINPNNASAYFSLSYIYRYTGMLDESIQEGEKALALDPDNRRYRSIVHTYLYSRDYEKALKYYYLDPNSAWGLSHRGEVYLRLGQRDKAMDNFDQAIKIGLKGIVEFWALGMKAYIEGDSKAGLLAAMEWEKSNPSDGETWYHIGSLYGLHNNSAGCIRAMKMAIEAGFFNYPYLLTDTFLNSIRDDEEFKEVLSLAKQKHEIFKSKFFK